TVTKRLTHRGQVNDIAWDLDGFLLGAACRDFDLYLWDVGSTNLPTSILLKGHEREPLAIAFSHDGSILASAGADETIRLWHVSTGKRLVTASVNVGPGQLCFAKNDQQLGCSVKGEKLGLFELEVGRECRTLQGHLGLVGARQLDISPDKRLMAS